MPKKTRRYFVAAAAASTFASLAFAQAPNPPMGLIVVSGISGGSGGGGGGGPVTGTIETGGSITIAGSGFGTLPSYSNMLDVPLAADYGTMTDGATVPSGASYPWDDNSFNDPDSMKFETSGLRTTDTSAMFYTALSRGYMQFPNDMTPGPEIYVSYWIKPAGDVLAGSHSTKFIRIWDNPNGLATRVSWTQMHLDHSDSNGPAWGDWPGNANQWNRNELYADAPGEYIATWVNGTATNMTSTFDPASDWMTYGLQAARVGLDAGGSSPPSFPASFSHMYVANSRARVEISSSATWAGAGTAKEVQRVTSWSDTELQIANLQLGQFDGYGGQLYLYVVYDDGTVSAPYEL